MLLTRNQQAIGCRPSAEIICGRPPGYARQTKSSIIVKPRPSFLSLPETTSIGSKFAFKNGVVAKRPEDNIVVSFA